MTKRMLRLGGFFSVPGNHLAGWRHPHAIPTSDMDFRLYAHITQVADELRGDIAALDARVAAIENTVRSISDHSATPFHL